MIKSVIADGKGTSKLSHLYEREEHIGQVVYTQDMIEFASETTPFINPDNGVQMAITGGFAGTPVVVNDGGDTTAWTGSNIVGVSVDFTSVIRPRTGSASVYVDSPSLSDVWQFAKGSNIDLSSYIAITMWINVDRRWGESDNIVFFGYDTNTTNTIGVSVSLNDYFTETNNDVWQKLVIPLEDMELTTSTIDAFRMAFVNQAGATPEFFIDDFQIEETTTSSEYIVTSDPGKILYINEIRLNFIDALNTTLLNSSMFNLSYNKILNESALLSGIFLSRTRAGKTEFSVSFKDINDFISRGFDITTAICDGTNTSIVLARKFTDFFLLDSREDDKISITINDDLSGLISFTATAFGKERNIDI
jgi:hypothetical protein